MWQILRPPLPWVGDQSRLIIESIAFNCTQMFYWLPGDGSSCIIVTPVNAPIWWNLQYLLMRLFRHISVKATYPQYCYYYKCCNKCCKRNKRLIVCVWVTVKVWTFEGTGPVIDSKCPESIIWCQGHIWKGSATRASQGMTGILPTSNKPLNFVNVTSVYDDIPFRSKPCCS